MASLVHCLHRCFVCSLLGLVGDAHTLVVLLARQTRYYGTLHITPISSNTSICLWPSLSRTLVRIYIHTLVASHSSPHFTSQSRYSSHHQAQRTHQAQTLPIPGNSTTPEPRRSILLGNDAPYRCRCRCRSGRRTTHAATRKSIRTASASQTCRTRHPSQRTIALRRTRAQRGFRKNSDAIGYKLCNRRARGTARGRAVAANLAASCAGEER